MGTLHSVYQLTPMALHGGALVKARQACEETFPALYANLLQKHFSGPYSHDNTNLQRPAPLLKIFGMNQEDRYLGNMPDGWYMLIQSGSKHGFDASFVNFMTELAPFAEDILFVVSWDDLVDHYEVKDGVLMYRRDRDPGHDLIACLENRYGEDKLLMSRLYIEEVLSMQRMFEGIAKAGDDPYDYFYPGDFAKAKQWIGEALQYCAGDEDAKRLKDWLNRTER